MPRPQVSVLLATYLPRPEWLRQAIESVRAQVFTELELLVLDDSRLPWVRQIVSSYQDDRMCYLPGPGKGPGANHAYGIARATAPLVSIINHDDVWEPEMLERLVEAYRSVPDAVLAFSDHSVMDESGVIDPARSAELSRQWKRASLAPGVHQPFDRLALLDGSVAIAQAAVFSRDVATHLDPGSGQVYDRYIAYLLARTGRPAVYVPERLAVWRDSLANLTSNRSTGGSVAYLRLSWRLFRDPALANLRGPLARRLLYTAREVLGSSWHDVRRTTRKLGSVE